MRRADDQSSQPHRPRETELITTRGKTSSMAHRRRLARASHSSLRQAHFPGRGGVWGWSIARANSADPNATIPQAPQPTWPVLPVRARTDAGLPVTSGGPSPHLARCANLRPLPRILLSALPLDRKHTGFYRFMRSSRDGTE